MVANQMPLWQGQEKGWGGGLVACLYDLIFISL